MTSDAIRSPLAIVVMGISGSGKSTLGARLAARLACPFVEGDLFHPPANVARMGAGLPLDDADRRPWLDRLAREIAERMGESGTVVAACSALKRSYRDRLRRRIDGTPAFLLLDADRDEIARRLAGRTGHYMPATLLDSQIDTLERPHHDERALVLNAALDPDALCRQAIAWLEEEA